MKSILLSIILLVFSTPFTRAQIQFNAAFQDVLEQQVNTILSNVCQSLKKGKMPCYLYSGRVFPGDSILKHSENHGFISSFNLSYHGAICESKLSSLAFYAVVRNGAVISLNVKLDDLVSSLSKNDIDKLTVLSLLFRNTNPNLRPNFYGALAPSSHYSTTFHNNLIESEMAVVTPNAFAFLATKMQIEVAQVLADSAQVTLYRDAYFKDPNVLNQLRERQVIKVPDLLFPGEFKDSVTHTTYNLDSYYIDLQHQTVKVQCQTGEIFYCNRNELIAQLPQLYVSMINLFYPID